MRGVLFHNLALTELVEKASCSTFSVSMRLGKIDINHSTIILLYSHPTKPRTHMK